MLAANPTHLHCPERTRSARPAPISNSASVPELCVSVFSSPNLSPFNFKLSTFNSVSLTPFAATLTRCPQIAEKPATLTPAFATLTSRVKHKSCVCRSYKKHPGSHPSSQNPAVLPAPNRKSPATALVLPLPPVTSHQSQVTKSFIIRTYKTQDLKLFRMNTYRKTGEEVEVKGLLRFAKMTGKAPDPENYAAKGLGTAAELGFAKSLCCCPGISAAIFTQV